ncbi:MAG: hypothetical protein GY866_29620 [Proteobacteria bacterium]|nr:hypothetical protein [Pseudomonadota bacterium]
MIKQLAETLSALKPHVIVAPPRTASTSVARCLYNHSSIHSYIHEPCGEYYHKKTGIGSILTQLNGKRPTPPGTLIKCMTFQMGKGEVANSFLKNAVCPPLFLLRDPKLAIESRIRRILLDLLAADPPSHEARQIQWSLDEQNYRTVDGFISDSNFSSDQTGWPTLAGQLEYCTSSDLRFFLLETDLMRKSPERNLTQVCKVWNMDYESGMLKWKNEPFPKGVLPEQKAWYKRVSSAQGIEPPTERSIPPERFPDKLKAQVEVSIGIYEDLLSHPNNISLTDS